nr:DMT family transporter [Aestuariivirga litoralis]
MNRTSLGIVSAIVSASFYGFVPICVRTAYNSGIPAIESTLTRTVFVATAFALIALLLGEKLSIPKTAWPVFLGQCVGTLLVSIAYLASVQFIPVGLAVIIFYLSPVLIMLIAPLVEKRAPGLLRILIAVLAFIGLAIAVGPSFDRLDMRGITLAFAAAFGYALQFFTGRALSHHMPPSASGSLVHAAILPPILVIALYLSSGSLQFLHGGSAMAPGWLALAALACVYLVAYLVQMLSLRFAPASTVAPFFNVEPVVTTIVAALLLGERMEVNQYLGGTIVLAALLASTLIGRAAKTAGAGS